MRALLIDLNNLSRYPTLGIGYLVAALRDDDIDVEVLSPLLHGVPPYVREKPQDLRSHLRQRALFASHPLVAPARDTVKRHLLTRKRAAHPQVMAEAAEALAHRRPDILLLSAYLDHRASVEALGALAAEHSLPVVLGGPAFADPDVARAWLDVPGLTALVGAEADFSLPAIVRDAVTGGDLTRHEGVFLPDGARGPASRPLADLSLLPTPDFSDFPWHLYATPVVPVMTGRGCSWGRCLFCSDVETTNGRTFRSRPVELVMKEIEVQAERHGARQVAFLDIKLNGDLAMWRGIAEHFQAHLPGGTWVGTVHVQSRGPAEDNGLSAEDLRAAYASGMRRISCGLETGSQRLNDSMAKGTRLERTSEFIRDAHAAGLSVRTTMMLGYPGETAADVASTHGFLREHEPFLDRIHMSPFKAIPGTGFARRHDADPSRYRDLKDLRWDHAGATASFRHRPEDHGSYRRERAKVLRLVHRINRRPLRDQALEFDGV